MTEPAQPAIPVGPATQIGQGMIAVLGACAAVSALLKGDHTPATLVSLGGAVITALTVMAGRYLQAYAHIRGPAQPAAALAPVVPPEVRVVLVRPDS